MKQVIVLVFLIMLLQTQAQLPQLASGTIRRIDSFKSAYVLPRTVDVWLPNNYNNQKKYPVLYMHDGQMLFDSTTTWNKQEWQVDETLTQLFASNSIKECIVVAIWNTGKYRHADYFPTKVVEALPTGLKDSIIQEELQGKTNADNYLKFLVKELKPFVDKQYSTLITAENTIIAGSSMGGLISMYAICEYPNVFGKAACLSTHWIGSLKRLNATIGNQFIQYLQANAPSPANHQLYFDYGMQGLDALYKTYQTKATQVLQTAGYNNKNLLVKEFPAHNHDEKSWSERLYIPLEFLLGK
jgi:predicted alpha/beta superfamily hydrolase